MDLIFKDIPVLSFESQDEFSSWLDKNSETFSPIWLRIYKKNSGKDSLNYAQALEVALCYGWIDSQKQSYDEISWLQRFGKRNPKSIWSKTNRAAAEKLIEDGRMREGGFKAIEFAKQHGKWATAYDSQANIEVPEDFRIELDKNIKAAEIFVGLNKINRYSVLFRIQTATSPELRKKKIAQLIKMLERNERFHQ
jgi:uncharacterized protein YdeI (YjbR/CyaY-like superfamily)